MTRGTCVLEVHSSKTPISGYTLCEMSNSPLLTKHNNRGTSCSVLHEWTPKTQVPRVAYRFVRALGQPPAPQQHQCLPVVEPDIQIIEY